MSSESWVSKDAEIDRRMASMHRAGQFLHAVDRAEDRALRRRVDSGRFVSPAPGVYTTLEEWERLRPIERARRTYCARARIHPEWRLCSFSAGLLYGLEVGEENVPHDVIHICSTSRAGRQFGGTMVLHKIPQDEIERRGTAQLVGFWRTVFDCMREVAFPRALAIADSALRLSGVTRAKAMRELKESGRHCKGLNRVLAIMRVANPLSENGGESIARATMMMLGFQEPELQVEMPDALVAGRPYRVDFFWRYTNSIPIAGELDGKVKYLDSSSMGGRDLAQVMMDERRRESRISMAGVKIVRFSYSDVLNVRQLERVLQAAGVPRDERWVVNPDV